ncbi:MAG: DNA polymerase III subunit gamma/tau [Proteobacteria bacterium]|nr:DNA polymerase III subunit gamma/tau [Pseudomonadota bacterium]
MSYLVLARKWRPQRFDEVVGQAHITRTLANAIKKDRVAHAFIFSGVRGVGKTSLARILAKSLNCQQGPTSDPCGQCDSCRAVAAGTAVDVIEIDGASNNSVDDIRGLRETVPYRPVLGRFKIYVIDEVHMLSISAFNALLKTLEEPPPHVKFIFATTESHKVPVTILSRCQRYDFRRIPTTAIVERIRTILNEEKIEADEAAMYLIGREAEGSMRDALSILDQILASGAEEISANGIAELLGMVEGQVFHDVSKAILNGDPRRVVEIIREVNRQGYDIPTFSKGLLEHFANLVVAGVCQGDKSVLDLPDQEAEALFQLALTVPNDTLHRLFKHFSQSYEAIARSGHPRILLETSLARIADLGELVSAHELVKRLEALSSAEGTVPPRSNPPSATGGSKGGPTRGGSTSPPVQKKTVNEPHNNSAPIETKPALDIQPPGMETQSSAPPINDVDWDRVVATLKREKPTLASILEYGTLHPEKDKRKLTIQFSGQYQAVANLATERRKEIADSIYERFGLRVGIVIRINESAPVPRVTRRKIEKENRLRKREEEARQHPLVRKVQAELGGHVQHVVLDEDLNKKI